MQREAVLHTEGPLLVLAGAGSGKTRALTHRIAYLIGDCGVSPYEILALTFTNKAAGEMKERVAKLVGQGAEEIWVSTFHSTCVRILRRFIDTIGYDRSFVIYDADDQKALMKEVLKYLNIDPKQLKEKTVLGVISHAKDELIDAERFAREAGHDPMQRKYADCYAEYQKRLKSNNALDFDDLIFKTIELFDINKEALGYYQRRFRYILVDEYQDTNTAQFELIRMLANHMNEYGEMEHNLCVVGDDDQSIYRFRGANIRNILDFEKTYPDAHVIRLEQNYRSTKSILDVANEVIKNNVGRKRKTLWTDNPEGDAVVYNTYENDIEESTSVASEIAALKREGTYEYSDFAILYRTNAQSRSFEERLIYRNIPYRIIGGQNFYQRREIKDMLAYLRTIDSGTDGVAVKRIINVPKRGIGTATIDRISEYAEERNLSFYDALKCAPVIDGVSRALSKISNFVSCIEVIRGKLDDGLALSELVDEILDATGYIDELQADEEPDKAAERVENINELISKMAIYEQTHASDEEPVTLAAFLDEVSLVADIDSLPEDNEYVVMMTIHSAKGLEFKNVYMVGMEEGLFPSFMSINADNPSEEIEEERRLCYVGMTRAQEHLTLTGARQRMMRGEIQYNRPSRFIGEIPRHLLHMAGKAPQKLRDTGYRQSRFDDDEGSSYRSSRYADHEERGNRSLDFANPGFGKTFDPDTIRKKSSSSNIYTVPGMSKPAAPTVMSTGDGSELGYGVGDSVRHIKFGVGTVKEIVRGGRDYEVTVEFPVGVKKMLASFAKLTKA